MKFSNKDRTFLAVMAVLLVLFSLGLYRHLNAAVGVTDREPVGILTFKRRQAERKLDESVVWRGLDNEVPVYNRDSIRTADFSEAVITLNDGTKIVLEDNSMIVLNFLDEEALIDFKYGGVQADGKASLKSGDTVIETEDGSVKVSGSGDEKVSVLVEEGQASMTSGTSSTTIEESEQATSGDGQIQKTKMPVRLNSPADQARFFTAGQTASVSFSWNNDGPGNLQIAQDRSFSNIVRTARAENSTASNLPAGVYYWRVVPASGAAAVPYRRFAVYKRESPKLLTPGPSQKITYTSNPPIINFTWTKAENATSYEVVLSTDRAGNTVIKRQSAFANSVAITVPAGSYFWKVVPKSPLSEAVAPSGTMAFQVTQQANIPAPEGIYPNNVNILKTAAAADGITFNWKKSPELSQVRLEVSSDRSFNNVVYNTASGRNFQNAKLNLQAGTYYWRLQTEKSSSTVKSFKIIEEAPVLLTYPADGQKINLLKEPPPVQLAWNNVVRSGRFRVSVSKNANLAGAKTKETSGTGIKMDLKPGTWYWKVERLAGTTTAAVSKVQKFELIEALPPPDLVNPVRNRSVDMTNQNYLEFSWKPVRGAVRYKFQLYRNGTNRPLIIRETRETRIRINDLSKLDTAGFYWTVQAVSATGSTDAVEARGQFRITLEEPEKPEFITPDTILF